MIKLQDNERLYFIKNVGCDDTTHGLAIISDDDFPKFRSIITNLNKNSTYVCMPKIDVYRIDPSAVREIVDEADERTTGEPLYLYSKKYIGVNGTWRLDKEGERVL